MALTAGLLVTAITSSLTLPALTCRLPRRRRSQCRYPWAVCRYEAEHAHVLRRLVPRFLRCQYRYHGMLGPPYTARKSGMRCGMWDPGEGVVQLSFELRRAVTGAGL